jgi:long-chain acyl-CoA synthetase
VFVHSDLTATVEDSVPAGVDPIEVPVPAEVAARYGGAPVTGRHAVLGEWIADAEPYAQPLENAPMSLIYTSGTTGLAKGVLRDAMTAEQSRRLPPRRSRRSACVPG